jgi:outer membrane receptor for ferrienterochelin and colicins
MRKYILFLAFVACALLPAKSATTAEPSNIYICGHVTDNKTKQQLPDINVSIKGTTIGTTTDASGHFTLNNPPKGDLILEFRSVGYHTLIKTVAMINRSVKEMAIGMDQDLISLDEIVVSSNRNESIKRLAPTLVNVLDKKLFENTNASCLAQALDFQTGVRVENNCQTCGTEQVRINGLDGPYTQILIDSRPVMGSLAGVYGLEQIPESMVDHVEVVKGGGSALYGSSAIAGTINIITKEPNNNSTTFSHEITSIGGSNAFDNTTSMNASLVTEDHKAGVALYGQSRYRDGYDHDGDGYTDLPELRTQIIGLRSYLKTSDYSKLSIEYHNINDYRRGGDHINLPPYKANVAEQAEHNINSGGIDFNLFSPDHKHKVDLYSSIQNTSRQNYSGTDFDLNAYGNTSDLTNVEGVQYTYFMDNFLFMPAELTGGAEFSYNHLHDQILGYDRNIDQSVYIESAYLQNEWKTDIWGILLGGRVDKHNLINHAIFSPRATLRYNPTKEVNFRMSYSTGFRAPQIYDEDLHVSAVGGQVSLISSVPNLKAENSQSFSASMDLYHTFGTIPTNFKLEGFYTNLSDVFVLKDIGTDTQGNTLKERSNGSGAKVMGITAEGKAVISSLFQLQAGATLQSSRYDVAENWSDTEDLATTKMLRTPDFYGYLTATLAPVKKLSVALSGTYTGSMLVPHAAGYIAQDENVTTPDFFDMNTKFSYTIPICHQISLQLNAGIQNIFDAYQSDADKGKYRDSDYVYGPSLPRSYFVGTKISF